MTPLVSICVPIYNVAPYIERCVCSLTEQTYAHIEYIFADDCSTDESIAVLRRTLKDYPNRKQVLIHSNDTNRGTAYTRQQCILQATGDYIIFVDPDDCIPDNAVERLVNKATSTDADVVCGAMIRIEQNRQTTDEAYTASGNSPIEDFLTDRFPRSAVAKIYKRSVLLASLGHTPEGITYGSDRLLSMYVCGNAKKIETVKDVVYQYMIRPDSCSATRSERQFENLITFWQCADEYLKQLGISDTYNELIEYDKVADKTHLMLHTRDFALRKKYADLFRQEEARQMHRLKRSAYIVCRLVHKHRWCSLRMYQLYINLRESIG